jgi:heat-inducible transcriptional repressor
MKSILDIRQKRILGAIIHEYIAGGEPVGSGILARKYGLSLSSASIRNVMSDLEEIGYLSQPHISAGRIPTIDGMRFYLEEILEPQSISEGDMSLIEGRIGKKSGNVETTLKDALYLLSNFSKAASVIVLPKPDSFVLKNIEFIRINNERVLVILVSRLGMVYNHIVYGEDISQDELIKYSNYLNDKYAGLTIRQMRDKLAREMSDEKTRFDTLVNQAISLSMRALDTVEKDVDMWIEGKESVFDYPGFADLGKIKEIVGAFEDKGKILRILNRVIESPGVKVFLGDDQDRTGIADCGVVAAGYGKGDLAFGSLGIIGPLRMDYSRVIPLVDYISKALGNLLEDI